MPKKQITTTLGGKKWRIRFVKDLGDCYGCAIHDPVRLIKVELGHDEKTTFSTILHEILHASMPDLSEDCVLRLEKEITNALWKLGVSMVDKDE